MIWLLCISLPIVYLVTVGYSIAFIKTRISKGWMPGWDYDVDSCFMGIFWPVTLLIWGGLLIVKGGMRLHGPERNRRREEKIARHENAIYGRRVS